MYRPCGALLRSPQLLLSTFSTSEDASHSGSGLLSDHGGDIPEWLVEQSGSQKTSLFVLSLNLPPVPPKLVRKIQSLDFINMRELLPDNMALTERLEALPHSAQQPHGHTQREVDSILTWACALLVYMAVLWHAICVKNPGYTTSRYMLKTLRYKLIMSHRIQVLSSLPYGTITSQVFSNVQTSRCIDMQSAVSYY